ncbi:MAG: AAA family ATPase [Armatimonadota bacterium]
MKLTLDRRTAQEIADMLVANTPFVVEGYVPRGTSTLISGEGESGKSLITEHLAMAVANGFDWMGHAVDKGPVIILDRENTAEFDLKPRLPALRAGFEAEGHEISLENIIIPELPERFALNDLDSILALSELCESVKPTLVIVDSLGDFITGGDSNSADSMFTVFNNVNSLMRKHNCAALVIHHLRKRGDGSNGNNSAGQRVRGSGAIRDTVRSNIAVSKTKSGLITIEHEKSNRGQTMDRLTVQLVATDVNRH